MERVGGMFEVARVPSVAAAKRAVGRGFGSFGEVHLPNPKWWNDEQMFFPFCLYI